MEESKRQEQQKKNHTQNSNERNDTASKERRRREEKKKNFKGQLLCAGNHFLSHSVFLLSVGSLPIFSRRTRTLSLIIRGWRQVGGSDSYLYALTGKGVAFGAERARQVAITVQAFLFVDRLVVVFLCAENVRRIRNANSFVSFLVFDIFSLLGLFLFFLSSAPHSGNVSQHAGLTLIGRFFIFILLLVLLASQ